MIIMVCLVIVKEPETLLKLEEAGIEFSDVNVGSFLQKVIESQLQIVFL